mmetsp:Transcript_62946/g.175352  ORF Transcript_62946/g.175352 Transcript_62946/m.175352 type:complete len:200 (-) Transcript_62946:1004-1603(-)
MRELVHIHLRLMATLTWCAGLLLGVGTNDCSTKDISVWNDKSLVRSCNTTVMPEAASSAGRKRAEVDQRIHSSAWCLNTATVRAWVWTLRHILVAACPPLFFLIRAHLRLTQTEFIRWRWLRIFGLPPLKVRGREYRWKMRPKHRYCRWKHVTRDWILMSRNWHGVRGLAHVYVRAAFLGVHVREPRLDCIAGFCDTVP